nr:hypothetical protein [Candidatus Sigynarchaeota archaeon]
NFTSDRESQCAIIISNATDVCVYLRSDYAHEGENSLSVTIDEDIIHPGDYTASIYLMEEIFWLAWKYSNVLSSDFTATIETTQIDLYLEVWQQVANDTDYYLLQAKGKVRDDDQKPFAGRAVSMYYYEETIKQYQFLGNSTSGTDGNFTYTFTKPQIYSNPISVMARVSALPSFSAAEMTASIDRNDIHGAGEEVDPFKGTETRGEPGNSYVLSDSTFLNASFAFDDGDNQGFLFYTESGSPYSSLSTSCCALEIYDYSNCDDFQGYYYSKEILFPGTCTRSAYMTVNLESSHAIKGKPDQLPDTEPFACSVDLIDYNGTVMKAVNVGSGYDIDATGQNAIYLNLTDVLIEPIVFRIRIHVSVRVGTKLPLALLDARDVWGFLIYEIGLYASFEPTISSFLNIEGEWPWIVMDEDRLAFSDSLRSGTKTLIKTNLDGTIYSPSAS